MHVLFCGAAIACGDLRGRAAVWIDAAALAGMIFYAALAGDGGGWSRTKTRGGMSAR